jgi:hypothetical protein
MIYQCDCCLEYFETNLRKTRCSECSYIVAETKREILPDVDLYDLNKLINSKSD